MPKIVLNTFGSFGDLHPFLALALALQKRGHQPVLATSSVYRQKIEAEGIPFAPVRPDVGDLLHQPAVLARLWNPRRGTEYLIRDVLAPHIEAAYLDLRNACHGADLLLTHTAAFAGPIVAEALRLPWLSTALQPAAFFSVSDPSILAPAAWLRHFQPLGAWPYRLARAYGHHETRRWLTPILNLRRRLNLSTLANPLFEGAFSPYGTLALFSPHFAPPQPDWPPHTTTPGFLYYDKLGAGFPSPSSAALDEFLAAGPAPVVFTLGSSAVMHPGAFFHESLAAARQLDLRAVLLVGARAPSNLPSPLPRSVFATSYAPYSELLPRAALTVHQGGIGTTAQALRAARPMLVVPWAHDQPDNAHRLERLGVALTLPRSRYQANRIAPLLQALLNDQRYTTNAQNLAARISPENALDVACQRIEQTLSEAHPVLPH